MKKILIFLITGFLSLSSSGQVISLQPNSVRTGKSISVTFTGVDVIFDQFSSTCPQIVRVNSTSSVAFKQFSSTTSSGLTTIINPENVQFPNMATSFNAEFTIPPNAPDGDYDVFVGIGTGCEVVAQKAFNIVANKPPTLVKSIDDQFVDLNGMGFNLNLATIFEDPDGDPLAYSLVEVNNEDVVEASIIGSVLSVSPKALGDTQITVKADDKFGGELETSFEVTVATANSAPEVILSIQDTDLIIGETFSIDLSTIFNDPDGDILTFSGESSNDAVALATITGTSLNIEGVGVGTAEITVIADDDNGEQVEITFVVNVTITGIEEELSPDQITIWPNPSSGVFNIKFENKTSAQGRIWIKDLTGRIILDLTINLGAFTTDTRVNLSGHKSGVYLMSIVLDGKTLHLKLLKE